MITLATLEEATTQEVFDQVSQHLLTQKQRSVSRSETLCSYRGDDGLKCAAGCLIDDKEYSPSMEGLPWISLVRYGFANGSHLLLIEDLQNIHDGFQPEEWKQKLIDVARKYILNTNKLNNETSDSNKC